MAPEWQKPMPQWRAGFKARRTIVIVRGGGPAGGPQWRAGFKARRTWRKAGSARRSGSPQWRAGFKARRTQEPCRRAYLVYRAAMEGGL